MSRPSRRLSSVGGVAVDSAYAPSVQSIVKKFGVKPTSGYRTAERNAEVSGAPKSDHLRGLAVDFGGTKENLKALYDWAVQQGFPYVEPLSESKDHVHISFYR